MANISVPHIPRNISKKGAGHFNNISASPQLQCFQWAMFYFWRDPSLSMMQKIIEARMRRAE